MAYPSADRRGVGFRFECYFDGCCEPVNPGGSAGFGAVIFERKARIWETSDFIPASPVTSNNVAEYLGFIAILDFFQMKGLLGESISIYGDSNLVIQQMFGTWKVHKPTETMPRHYVSYALDARARLKLFKRVRGFWIPREENGLADELSKTELKRRNIEFRIQPEEVDA